MTNYRTILNKKILLALLCICLLIGIWYGFIRKEDQTTVTTQPSTTQEEDFTSVAEGTSAKNANSVSASSANNDQNNNSQTELIVPTGNFVSSHYVSASTAIESICTTSRGAACTISFQKGDTVKSLDKKSVNDNGTARWEWTPGSLGLSSGSWTITAKASSGSNTSSSRDPLALEVSQ